jgi:hypothetical protein
MTTHVATDSTGAAAADPDEAPQGGDSGVVGNERLTALAGVLLLVLILVEIATVLTLRTLMSVHILVGVLMVGPLAVKLGSTGYRFVRYYTRSAAYVRRGPPARPLRLLAPLLVVTTVVLVASGIGLVVTGPAEPGPLLALHNVTFLVWLPLIAVHAVAYLARALRLTAADSTEPRATSRLGRGPRLVTNGASLLLGAIGALLLLPGAPWNAWSQATQPIPAPLIVGTVLTILVLLVARPRRWTYRTGR